MSSTKKGPEKGKRAREENFTEEDKMFLVEFISEHGAVLESKASDPKINLKKKNLWAEVSEKFRARGRYRDPNKLKTLYNRLKQHAKTTISAHKRSLHKTGGGPSDAVEPTELDWVISTICPVDFTADHSDFDSDQIVTTPAPARTNVVPSEENVEYIAGLVDPITGMIFEDHLITPLPVDQNPVVPKVVFPTLLPESEIEVIDPPSNPSAGRNIRKRKSNMSSFEAEMLKVHSRHINQKISNEKLINEKEVELLNLKLEAERLRIDYYKNKFQ